MRDFKALKITVAGTGYVGLPLAVLLSQHHEVTAVDIVPEKVEKLNKRISPIQDEYIEKFSFWWRIRLVRESCILWRHWMPKQRIGVRILC